MKNGNHPHPIPPNLLALLGAAERTFDGKACWSIPRVAAAVGCCPTCVRNWIARGCIPDVIYDAGRWWITDYSIKDVVAIGPQPPDTYPRRKARNFPTKVERIARSAGVRRANSAPRN